MNIIALDIGGTKTRLVYAELQDAPRIRHEARYPSNDFPALEPMLERFIAEAGLNDSKINMLSLALPGATGGEVVSLTNLPWIVNRQAVREHFQADQVLLINDFQAAALGVDRIDAAELVTLNPGVHGNDAIRVVIGAGTGLGLAWLQGSGSSTTAWSTEGGHLDFAPANRQQADLLEQLRHRYAHVSFERVLSGSGLVALYEFCSGKGNADIDPADVDALAQNGDPAASAALRLFVQIYGNYAGNIALLFKPQGGIFIAGGIAAKILPWMQNGDFLAAYRARGRMQALAESIPVSVVTNERLGAIGALAYALNQLQAAHS